ncbi:MAG: PQQ-binding-like beta-propeller repeat protein [Deltaproteobacteria bacterium]|nr:PQQ-binding-like beta-propeller repeat protein [Deltaproteobacteria bacterium]
MQFWEKVRHSPVKKEWTTLLKRNSFWNKKPFQFAIPLLTENKLFVGVHKGSFYAIDAEKGKKLWKFRAAGPIHASARVSGGNVYFADAKGEAYALNQETGETVWVTRLGYEVMSAPLIVDDKIFFVTMAKDLFCLDRQSGKIVWQVTHGKSDFEFTLYGSSDPVLVSGQILVGYSDGTLTAHSPQNGDLLWSKSLGDPLEPFRDIDATLTLSADADKAYLMTADGKLFAINPANGSVYWTAPYGGVDHLVMADTFIYGTSGSKIFALQKEGGETAWEQELPLSALSAPAVRGDVLTVAATKGKVYFLNRLTGDIDYSWHTRGGSYSDPVTDQNHVYILSNAARLYSFRYKK